MDRKVVEIRGQIPYGETSEGVKGRPALSAPGRHHGGAAMPAPNRTPCHKDSGAMGESMRQSSRAEGSGASPGIRRGSRSQDRCERQAHSEELSGPTRVVDGFSALRPTSLIAHAHRSSLRGHVIVPCGTLVLLAPPDPMRRGDAVRIQVVRHLTPRATPIPPKAAEGRRCA